MDTIGVRPAVSCRIGALRALVVVLLAGWLGGCAVPPALALAGYLSDGALEVATGKDSTDTGLSLATGKDCATSRLLWQEDICRDKVDARPEPLPPQLAQDEAASRRRVEAMPAEDAERARLAEHTLDVAFQPMAVSAAVRPAGGSVVALMPRPASPATVVAVPVKAPPVRLARHPHHHHAVRLAHRHRPARRAKLVDGGHRLVPLPPAPILAVAGEGPPPAFLP